MVVAVTATAAGAATTHHARTSSHMVTVPQGSGAAAIHSATPTGVTDASTPVDVSFILRARSLDQLESKVQNGWSGKYLTTSQFAATYGQTPKVINTIVSYLDLFGISTKVYADNLDISATGTAAEFDQALSVTLKNFNVKQGSATRAGHSVSRTVYGSQTDPQMPSDVASPILAILGLSNYAPFVSQAIGARGHETRASLKAAAGSGIPAGNGLAPADFEKDYNLSPLENQGSQGQGQTIGIVTLASINHQTPITFWNKYLGLNEPQSRLTLVPIDGGAGAVSLDNGSNETDIDVEQSGAIAPKANVRVYEAPNTDPGFADGFFAAASDNIADTVSVSWGESDTIVQLLIANALEPDALAQVFDEAFAEMGAQGQSNFTATGDFGAYQAVADAGTTNITAASPSDSPYTTATGGTTLPGVQNYSVTNSKGQPTATESINIPSEIAWGWDYLWPLFKVFGAPDEATVATDPNFIGGSNGGYSTLEPRPSYQTNVSNFNDRPFLKSIFPQDVGGLTLPTGFKFSPRPRLFAGSTTTGRATPDVSTNGDPQTGYAVYDPKLFSDTADFSQFGGVSFVAPQLNGATAVIDSSVGHRVGFWNPVIYPLASSNHSPFTPIDTTQVFSGKTYLSQTSVAGKTRVLPGEFTSTNLFYTGLAGSLWNPAVGLGTPDLSALAGDFGH
jgi:subtilase family serine protease